MGSSLLALAKSIYYALIGYLPGKILVKSLMGLNKRLHQTPLVPLIVLLLVCSPLSCMQIKSLFC